MTREDLFSLPKSLCLNGTLFKRQTRNVFASENPRHRFAGWFSAPTSSHAVCSQSVTARRRRAAPLQSRSSSPETWQPRLPTEVWCAIWACLPFSALIVVTHTCQRWRLAALACTTLWTRPQFYTTVTGHLSLPHIHPYGRHPAEQPGDVGSANFSWATAVLARSQNLGLHITLDVPKRGPDLALIADLGITLSLASGRIASITVRAADTDAACALLREMRSLPALRSLVFRNWDLPEGNFRPRFVSFVPSDMCAPELETVELAPGFHWPPDSDGPQFPNVRRISLAPRYDICRELGPALDACSALEYLTVDLAARPYLLVGLGAMLQSRCAALSALRLTNVSASIAECSLFIFHSPEIPDVSLPVSQDASSLAGRIFRDLGAAVRLAVLQHGDHVTVAATDGEGRARRVSCAQTAQSQSMPRNEMLHAILHEHIDWCNVLMLSVSLSLWYSFVEALPGAPAVTCLRVIMPSGRVVFDAEPLDYDPVATREKFPALQMLDIVGADGAPRMMAHEIAAIVRGLGVNLPLVSLGIDHTIFKGSRAALRGLARKVSIRIYGV